MSFSGLLLILLALVCSSNGIEKADLPLPKQARVAYGERVPASQQRYYALMTAFDQNFGESFCGASVIAEGVILTAAHCVVDDYRNPYDLFVTLFSDKDSKGNGTMKSITTQALDVAIPDVYNPAFADWKDEFYGDIALVRVDPNLTHSFVLIPQTKEESSAPIMLASGMGLDETQKESPFFEFVSLVKKTKPPQYSQLELEKDHFVGVDRAVMKQQDTCVGDSGGPVVVPSRYWNVSDPEIMGNIPNLPEKDILVGIVSYGDGSFECGQSQSFGVYTDVYYWKDWIENQVNEWKST
jgi:secreted trypsin-like serine protease